ncbi:MAG: hypothetical protein V3R20_00970 [Sphingomonadales bacterium]
MPSEKTLKRIVIILGVLIVGGFAVVVGTIIVRSLGSGPDQPSDQTTAATGFAIPDGAKILGGSRNGETIIFHFETLDGIEKVVVVDTRTGAVIGELEMEPR